MGWTQAAPQFCMRFQSRRDALSQCNRVTPRRRPAISRPEAPVTRFKPAQNSSTIGRSPLWSCEIKSFKKTCGEFGRLHASNLGVKRSSMWLDLDQSTPVLRYRRRPGNRSRARSTGGLHWLQRPFQPGGGRPDAVHAPKLLAIVGT